MGISDVIFETMNTLIEECADYYDVAERLEILRNDDVLEVVACHLKVDNRRSFCKPSKEDITRINAINWKEKAKEYVKDYLKEHHLLGNDSDSEFSDDSSQKFLRTADDGT